MRVGHDNQSIPHVPFILFNHNCGMREVHVAPFQGLACSCTSAPRALPWAFMLQPLRGKQIQRLASRRMSMVKGQRSKVEGQRSKVKGRRSAVEGRMSNTPIVSSTIKPSGIQIFRPSNPGPRTFDLPPRTCSANEVTAPGRLRRACRLLRCGIFPDATARLRRSWIRAGGP